MENQANSEGDAAPICGRLSIVMVPFPRRDRLGTQDRGSTWTSQPVAESTLLDFTRGRKKKQVIFENTIQDLLCFIWEFPTFL